MRSIPTALSDKYIKHGWWTRDTLADILIRGLHASPDAEFRVYSDVRPWTGTFADVEFIARRLAEGLRKRGVGPGDAVAFQLPNWMEAAATFWASSFLGAVAIPIVHFYGPKEVRHILATAKPKVFITFDEFGPLRYNAEPSENIPIVGVVGRDFDTLLDDEPMSESLAVSPSAPAVIAFTSGTTSDAKGVVHSHQTLGFETRQLGDSYPVELGSQLTAAPVGHFIGMLNAFLIPVLQRTAIFITDAWNPQKTLSLMLSDKVTFGGGTPYFVSSLLDHPDFTPEHLEFMRYAGMGGSSVPATVAQRLHDQGVTTFRYYGTTEHPSITGSHFTDSADKRLFTDGKVMEGVEIRLAEDGEILSRGPDLCLGYLDDELTRQAFDKEGWYHTGDVGIIDADGYLTVTDRKSDIIIRGGENISALEVEEALLGMPGIAEAAAVAAPNARLGEHTAAVVRVLPGSPTPTIGDVRAHFEKLGLAKQKWPEEVLEVEDLPRTATGKVQKAVIRRMVADRAAAAR
jgi:acyl-CoA synthetase